MPNGWRLLKPRPGVRDRRRKPIRGEYVRVAIRTHDIFDMGLEEDNAGDAFYIGHGLVIRKLDPDEHDEFDALYRDVGIDMYRVLMFGRELTDTFCEHDLEPISAERINDEPETGFLDLVGS